MRQVRLTLDFVCCHCSGPVTVTVECSGQGLDEAAERLVAAVKVPCPHCSGINELYFEPSGTIHAVTPCGSRRVPEPSLN